jgi:hypothetical protein
MQPTIKKSLYVPRINEQVQIKPCHHQFHEIFYNIPKITTMHHSMNFFHIKIRRKKKTTLATKPNFGMHDTSNKNTSQLFPIASKIDCQMCGC